MKLKKIFAILVCAALALSVLGACGDSASSKNSEKSGAASGGGGEGLKIAIVTSPSGVDDGSFNQDNYIGVETFVAANPGAKVTAIREPDINNSVNAVANIVADYDVIVCPGFQFAGISQIAVDNPEKKFILVDSNPDPLDGKEVFENIYAMTFAEEESGFFAGVAAALESKTGKVAVVNGIAFPSNVNYQYGFESGVNYAKAHFDSKTEFIEIASYAGTDVTDKNVGGNYVGDFSKPDIGKVVGEALLKEGADIIFVAAGNSGNGVFTAVKEHGNAMVIGCDVDQYADGENNGKNIVLTSALKVMHLNVDRALTNIQNGTFKGENVLLHADTDSTGFVSEAGHQQLSKDTLDKLDEVYKLVKEGKIVPASFFNGHTSEDFPGLK